MKANGVARLTFADECRRPRGHGRGGAWAEVPTDEVFESSAFLATPEGQVGARQELEMLFEANRRRCGSMVSLPTKRQVYTTTGIATTIPNSGDS